MDQRARAVAVSMKEGAIVDKPNWEQIKAEYITSSISYRQLASKWCVPFRTLADRGRREEWVCCRENHCNNVVTKTVQKVANNIASTQAEYLIELQAAADCFVSAIDLILHDTEQFNRHLVQIRTANGIEVIERLFQKVDTKAIRDLARSLKDLTIAVLRLYDIPTAHERAAMERADRRLKLNERRYGKNDDRDNNTGVYVVSFADSSKAELAK